MSDETRAGGEAALVADELRGHVRALADEYGRFRRQGEAAPAVPAAEGERPAQDGPIEPKAFQARHAAGRAALAHLALLLKLAGEGDGEAEPAEESEEDLLAEARRNLERPA